MRKFNASLAIICYFLSLLIAFCGFLVGVIGLIFADKHYLYEVGCGLDFICAISHAYYTTHPFLIGLFGLLGASIVLWFALKVDEKLEQEESAATN